MNQKLVSIIVPVYNVEDYLQHCLGSIYSQTYKNIEVILVDDGSTDRSGAICDEYARTDHRAIVIHKPNGGVSSARNMGLRKASGECICFVDSDDYIHPQYIEVLLHTYTSTNADIVICDYAFVKEYPSTFCRIKEPADLNIISYDLFSNYPSCKQMIVVAKIYNAKILKNHYFDENVVYSEDGIFNYSLVYSTENLKIITIPQILYYYYQRTDSATHTLTRDVALSEIDWYLRHWDVFLKEHQKIVCEHAIKTMLQIRMETYLTPAYNNVMEQWPGFERSLIKRMKAIGDMPKSNKIKYYVFLKCFWLYRLLLILNDPTIVKYEKKKKSQKPT